ncbi:MAG: hypothetical protein QM775_23195 [Pirellulales bacterium]
MAKEPAAEKADAKKSDAKKKGGGMDQLVKNQFWILCGILVITAAVVWYLGVSSLDLIYAKDVDTNDKAFKRVASLKALSGPNSPPNDNFAGKVDERRNALTGEVLKAWKSLYDRQTQLFTVNPKVQIFRDFVLMEPDDRKTLLALPANSQLNTNLQAAIQTYHNNQVLEEDFAQLFAPLNVRRPRGMDAFGKPVKGAAGGDGPPEGLVVWRAAFSPQNLMLRYDTKNAPSLDRIAVAYEDIWTFRSLFGVIMKINEKPSEDWLAVMEGSLLPSEPARKPVDQANVPIKRIDYCDVAQYAMNTSVGDTGNVQNTERQGGGSSGGLGGGEVFDPGLGAADQGAGSGFAVGNEGNEGEDKALLKNRYLDGRNAPVTDPSNPPFTEFRQMFVQLTVMMDQRLIPVLVSQCANAPIPIETRQIRINLAETDRIRRSNAEDAAGQVDKVEQSSHDAIVTLRGIVFIYTKNDPEVNQKEDFAVTEKRKLGKGADPEPARRDYGVPTRGASSATDPSSP